MTSVELSRKLRKKLFMQTYLNELSILLGRKIEEVELLSVEMTDEVRKKNIESKRYPKTIFEMDLSERKSEKFQEFIHSLSSSNSSPVYLWTPRSIDCGVLTVDSLKEINFCFDFNFQEEGVFSVSTTNFLDHMVVDFSEEEPQGRLLEIELQGVSWPYVEFYGPDISKR